MGKRFADFAALHNAAIGPKRSRRERLSRQLPGVKPTLIKRR
jgi:hypothetical protein